MVHQWRAKLTKREQWHGSWGVRADGCTRRIKQWPLPKDLLARIEAHRSNLYFRSSISREHHITDNNRGLWLVLHKRPYSRPVIIDIDAATYFGADTQTGIPRQVRILHCGDPCLLKYFLTTALTGVLSQKLDDKLFDLATRMRTAGHATEENERELNNIDIALMETLLLLLYIYTP